MARFISNLDVCLGSWNPVAKTEPFIVFGFLEFGDFSFEITQVGSFVSVFPLSYVKILFVFADASIELV